ncbi:MAG TPA: ResB protein required for cytochrome C biosynthesis [Phycisphaerales bacterium]|nr:ResB protein required for cytochrome C biosynthesis [Phycisphaerales bacterium]
MIRRLLKPLASLRLTVVLFALSMFLIFAGTLAQVRDGVWTVVDQYFRSPFVLIDLQLFVPEKIAKIPGAILFPGGFTLGIALLINLIAAHAVRFKLRWKRMGIIITHLGVIFLLVGEFVTGLAAQEGKMTIIEGQSANYTEDIRTAELAIVDPSGSDDDLVVVVPQHLLTHPGSTIQDGLLPFKIHINEWMPNSQILGPNQTPPERKNLANAGLASSLAAIPIPKATGVDGQSVDVPAAYISLTHQDKPLGTYLVSVHLQQPQTVIFDGQAYQIELRFKRTYKPYTIHLIDFKHDLFTGTNKARNYSSQIRLVDEAKNVDREVLIYMNHPLRYAGETFYQQSFLRGDTGTILQVVKNPGWLIPYISCIMITIGMLWHFGLRLAPTLRRKSS